MVLNSLDERVPDRVFYGFHELEKQKLIKADRSSQVGWPAPGKLLWKTTTKIKVSFTEKKEFYFKESFTFQNKCCILKKVSYEAESFIFMKEILQLNRGFITLKESIKI